MRERRREREKPVKLREDEDDSGRCGENEVDSEACSGEKDRRSTVVLATVILRGQTVFSSLYFLLPF